MRRSSRHRWLLPLVSIGLLLPSGGHVWAENSTESSDDGIVSTVKIDDDRTKTGTSSGEQEGVSEAPDFVPDPDVEQHGDTDLLKKDDLSGRSDAAREAFSKTRTTARTMSLLLPAPRGQILDRKGEPLAQTQVAYQLALRFGQFEDESREHVVSFARRCLTQAHKIADQTWEFSDEKLWKHYVDRRWLPLPVTNVIRADAAEKIREAVEKVPGLELLPIYIRFYPEKETLAHIIGYVGSKGKLPVGPINHMDPLWEQTEGRSGLEREFDGSLNGKPGVWRLMFDENGNKILDELQSRPKPGGALVTTLNLDWQKKAEKALSSGARRGAMVVLDCDTGEVLVMASTPSYDPNKFIPNISQKDYDALRKNPANPLVSRAFQGKYPPASTFKVITVLSALKNGVITENTMIDCPASITIGNHVFKNWSKSPAGSINCVRAIAMSNNPFMYQVGMRLGGDKNARVAADKLLDTARLYGYGTRTKLPISDQAGLVPDNNYMVNVFRRSFMFGDVANMAIGQGVLLATPLQVAHAMTAIANGVGLPKLQIVKQIQDSDANVIYAANKEIQTPLAEYAQAAAVVRKGMREVVEGGTGSRARLSYASIAGKSGTAQWGPESEDRRLAWFAGFMPVEKPRYAYAVLYEGLPHERIGGGAKAAPIVKEFFESVKSDIKKELEEAEAKADAIPVAAPVDDDDSTTGTSKNGGDVTIISEIDDSSDTPSGTATNTYSEQGTTMYPQPGDADYIPGLQRQIPRNIGASSRRSTPTDTTDDIPLAEPLDE